MYDICIIGGGPSGLMAAVSASFYGKKILLVEKNEILGKKLLLSGGGRCNITNNCNLEQLLKSIPDNAKFLYSTFSQFDNQDIINFFNQNGLPLIEEDHGRMFPNDHKAQSVIDVLYNLAKQNNVEFMFNTKVKQISTNDNQKINGVILNNDEFIECQKVIVCCGGMSYPQTGSNGDGYNILKNLNHEIAPLYACESPLFSKEHYDLQGISFNDATINVYNNKNKIKLSIKHDLIFTHFGLSGPAALRCSGIINKLLKKQNNVIVTVSPYNKSFNFYKEKLQQIKKEHPKQTVINALKSLFPDRYLKVILDLSNIKSDLIISNLSNDDSYKFAQYASELPFTIYKTLPIEKSFVTGGGVKLSQINPKTLESKITNGLYIAGELLDLYGYTGGFNITIALCSGFVSGMHAAISE